MINSSDMEPSDDYIRLEEPKKKESFCSIFCACKCKDNFKSIYTRRESALYPLDGLRACAMLWVFIFHLAIFWNPYFEKCMGQANPIMRFISSGDAGVDIFFTLWVLDSIYSAQRVCQVRRKHRLLQLHQK